MAQKSIETLLKLSANPNYRLTQEEMNRLREYHQTDFNRVKHSTEFKKDHGVVEKHDTELTEE